jgi:hypothetical protein
MCFHAGILLQTWKTLCSLRNIHLQTGGEFTCKLVGNSNPKWKGRGQKRIACDGSLAAGAKRGAADESKIVAIIMVLWALLGLRMNRHRHLRHSLWDTERVTTKESLLSAGKKKRSTLEKGIGYSRDRHLLEP